MSPRADVYAQMLIMERAGRVHGLGNLTVHSLSRATLSVRRGELVAVMGPSGSGKSTLLNLAGALDRPTTGRVLIDGVDVTTLNPRELAAVRRRKVGFIFQDFNLIPSLTAQENVALPLELDGVARRVAAKLARTSLESVGLAGIYPKFPDEMSGGQRQRVAIARALVGERRLVLADEPTGALDSATGDQILQVIRERCDAGAAGLLVTHEARHAAWADRVIFLRDGVIVDSTAERTADELLQEAN